MTPFQLSLPEHLASIVARAENGSADARGVRFVHGNLMRLLELVHTLDQLVVRYVVRPENPDADPDTVSCGSGELLHSYLDLLYEHPEGALSQEQLDALLEITLSGMAMLAAYAEVLYGVRAEYARQGLLRPEVPFTPLGLRPPSMLAYMARKSVTCDTLAFDVAAYSSAWEQAMRCTGAGDDEAMAPVPDVTEPELPPADPAVAVRERGSGRPMRQGLAERH